MATVLGNLALPVDLTLPAKIISDHRKKLRLLPYDIVLGLNLPKREKEFQLWGEVSERGSRVSFSRKSNAVEYSSDEENGNGNGNGEDGGSEDEEVFDWETQMRKRVKELEEMRELEKKAEELQGMVDDEVSENFDDETEEEKKMRVRKELEKVAKEQAERRATAKLMFELGQKAYGRGMYERSIEFFEAALTIIPRPTLFGGEIQIWLAMGYEANNRHADCIALYQQLEKGHPSVSIRRQAAELRYILQAPKIKITQEEMVTIPLIGSSYDSYASSWTDKSKDSDEVIGASTATPYPSSRDYMWELLKWKPPSGLENNRVFWAAVTLWLGLVGAALFIQR
ncbi:hypothetical protein BVRB_6g148190 [Beta vulgaris subsp. vulgaris]|nr:hypothetical protein BVRB_6g148190 [Beta vulgaris subsp. vulgaris]